MRKNLPITQNEVVLVDGGSIVSITDLKGVITYANPYFIEVSGYTKEELLGKAHNILRHPDVPAEAFRDLWDTIKQGKVWNGLVKNRCKNGDFYWVAANVTPVIERGQPVGYMSVRTKPTREQIAAAEDLYRRMNGGEAERISLRGGKVIMGGFNRWLHKIIHPKLTSLIRAACGIQVLSILTATVAKWLGFASIEWVGTFTATVAVLGVLLTIWLWYFLETNVIASMQEALHAAHRITGGDLTSTVESDRSGDMGEFLATMRQMNINLHGIIKDVHSGFELMLTHTHEIAHGNMDLSGRTEAQAASLEETASSMEQLASTVENNARHASNANELATRASSVAQEGGRIVGNVIETIGEINQSSKKIVDIISIIDSLSFQTNILALNAAVEAARAGEQGRGFAVVASEVRTLAQRSAAAANEIKALIESSVSKVDAGTVLANQAGTTMHNIIEAINQVNVIMGEISQASREQSMGISQVNQAIAQMDDVTQRNAALVEEAAAATASLERQAVDIVESLAVFKMKDRPHSDITVRKRRPKQ